MSNTTGFASNQIDPVLKAFSLGKDVRSPMVNPIQPDESDMTICEQRLNTYREWPKCMRPTGGELAPAGFYYTGIGDRVKCFSCNICIKDWEPFDQPWGEHARLSPNCSYLKMAYCKPKPLFGMEQRGLVAVPFPATTPLLK